MLLSLGVLFTLRFFGLGETKPAIVTELRPQYRLVYVAPDPDPVVPPVAYQHYISPPEQLLTPPDRLQPQQQQHRPLVAEHHNPRPILGNHVSDSEMDDDDDDNDDSAGMVEGYEVSQFHSEDDNGKVVYGFRSPDQSRMEARDSDGTVRGMYSYIDALGHQVQMHYWDDGHGMHMAGNNLPIAMYQMPEFTPEVKAAREEHFRLYEAALTALKAAGLEIEGQELEEENDDEHFIVPPLNGGSNEHDPEGSPFPSQQNPSSASASDEEDDFDHLVHEPVIIENESIEKDPVAEGGDDEEEEYPKYEYTPLHHHAASPVQHVDNEDKESVAIENPEFRSPTDGETASTRRQGKSREIEAAETQHGSTAVQKKTDEPPKNEEKQVDSAKPDTKSSLTKEQVSDLPGGAKTFFYHFTHVIPKPVERVDDVSAITSGSLVQTSQQHPVYRPPVV